MRCILTAAILSLGSAAFAQTSTVTFTKDVLPILQKNCQSCHRPGEIAPMSFLTYESTRPYARAIKAAVLNKTMPPWFADPQHGRFLNDRSLTSAEMETLVKWVDSGANAGKAADAPSPANWPEGWQIKPDVIVDAPEYTIPSDGTLEWGYVAIPSGFTQDTWVTSIEIRPGDRQAVHHVVMFIAPSSPEVPHNVVFWDQKKRDLKGVASGQQFQANELISATGQTVNRDLIRGTAAGGVGGPIAAVYVPGGSPHDYRIHRAAKLIPANSNLVFQVHYTPVGRPVTERTRIGFTLASQEPTRQFSTRSVQPNWITDTAVFRIPAGDPNWSSPPVEVEVNADIELVWMMPHMHSRGKAMTYRATFPDGRVETLLNVPRYDFEWQLGYDVDRPIRLPKGTVIRVDATFDNSAGNRGNPDPTVHVFGGTQTWEEMLNPWFGIIVDRSIPAPADVLRLRPSPSP
jgi:hypothetical protein